MIRALILLVKVGLLILSIILVTGFPGIITLQWENYLIETTTPIVIFSILGLFVFFYLIGRLFQEITLFPRSLRRFFRVRTLKMFEDSLLSVCLFRAAGDTDRVEKELKILSDLAKKPALKLYLMSKAEQIGKSSRQSQTLLDLTTVTNGEFLGYRDLMQLALDKHMYHEALDHGEKAFHAFKKSPWIIRKLLALYLYDGCLGRVISFSEIEDGYFVILQGICRFDLGRDLTDSKVMKEVSVDYGRYSQDLEKRRQDKVMDRERLMVALKKYLNTYDINADWQEIVDTPNDKLVTALAMSGPFTAVEKQALLESVSLPEQCCIITTLMEMALLDSNPVYQ